MNTAPIIAVLGGTFDPIHYGHIHLIEQVQKIYPCMPIWLMPNATPPHKPPTMLNADTRLKLCALATEHLPNVHVKRIEFDLPQPSYTFHTLEYLKNNYPDTRFIWLLGMDAWQKFDCWYRWQETLKKAEWLILERPHTTPLVAFEHQELAKKWMERKNFEALNNPQNIYNALDTSIWTFTTTAHPASSTMIRQAYAAKNLDTVNQWLPPCVHELLTDKINQINS